jgi:hypothetical protein
MRGLLILHEQQDAMGLFGRCQSLLEFLHATDLPSIHLADEHATTNPGGVCPTARIDLRDNDPYGGVIAELCRQIFTDCQWPLPTHLQRLRISEW